MATLQFYNFIVVVISFWEKGELKSKEYKRSYFFPPVYFCLLVQELFFFSAREKHNFFNK